ncbi:hypothetical protein BLNAU_3499 [Blattamonas nauphoetae]|uniref:Uncharacterized protein n=1 Tax=Blattamonas nauphoetae TaxID=2049346 RepID=A0ABQ9YC90_9EUKA|nr:hypothetical protein BLNAU_3499 [Blattamonas nauphoetae]
MAYLDPRFRVGDRTGDLNLLLTAEEPTGVFGLLPKVETAGLHINNAPQTQAPIETEIEPTEYKQKFDDTKPLLEQDFQFGLLISIHFFILSDKTTHSIRDPKIPSMG